MPFTLIAWYDRLAGLLQLGVCWLGYCLYMCYSHGYLLGSPGGGMAAVQSVLWSISVGQCIVAHKVLLYRSVAFAA